MPMPTIWHIPYERNRFFTGREEVLIHLHHTLQADARVTLSHPLGISGLGGIGKTQTALEYAYRYGADYDAVLWVRAESVTALIASLVQMAQVLKLPERYEKDQEIIVEAVLRWLRNHTRWLLIYDNIDDLAIAEPFLPREGTGHLLLTTRAHALSGVAQRVEIQKMTPDIGALLLLRRASLLALEASLESATFDEQSIARATSQELAGLPLALDQAGAYIKEAPCPLAEYLTRYQTRHNDILRTRGSFDQDYPESVATTWSLSFEKVRHMNASAAELLNFCAFLAPDAIPEKMLTLGAPYLPPILQEAVTHPITFDGMTTALLNYSLLQRNTNQTLDIHRLVQVVIRENIPAKRHTRLSQVHMIFRKQTAVETQEDWMQRAVHVVNAATPEIQDINQWNDCEQWVPHVLVCAGWIEEAQIRDQDAGLLLNEAGHYLQTRARYAEAEPLFERALSIRRRLFGSEHPATALSLNNQAELYRKQGKYRKVERLYMQSLKIRERRLGPEHLDTAQSLNNLALLYQTQGRYAEAVPLYKRALEIFEQQLGTEHPDTAKCLNNLGGLYHNQKKYSEAELLYKQALEIYTRLFGTAHPDTAQSLNNLGGLYKHQGKYSEAEPLYKQALEIFEQLLGPEHPNTATSLNNLALLYIAQGKYQVAEPLCERALSINERNLGPEHADTAQSLNSLAGVYDRQGKYREAVPLYKRALTIFEQQFGANHPLTHMARENYESLLSDLGGIG